MHRLDIQAEMSTYPAEKLENALARADHKQVQSILESDNQLTPGDFLILLSEAAEPYLEQMAQKARQMTVQYFGHTIGLYAPLYISNYCESGCLYCGFSRDQKIPRQQLTTEQIRQEAKILSGQGIRHVLILTGEAEKKADLPYLLEAVRVLKEYFPSISIEIYPMESQGYKALCHAGVDGLTIYQEVYDPVLYKKYHRAGKKQDYDFRFQAPQRGAEAGFRAINIGPLFGLGPVRTEAFYAGHHAWSLMRAFPDTEVSISMPRIKPEGVGFTAPYELCDRLFAQFLVAYRLFMPRLGITLSTRESADFRNNLLPLGVTRMSAGSSTEVGGYSHEDDNSVGQFAISDLRSAAQVEKMLMDKGYQPVWKDWERV